MIDKEYIGKRLAALREELSHPGEDAWTQTRLAEATGLTRNIIARLEQTCSGSIEACMTLLNFYHERGFNISWIVLQNNSTVSKLALADASKAVDAHLLRERVTEFKQILDSKAFELLETLFA